MKQVLYEALRSHATGMSFSETYAITHGFRNLDVMLEYLVFESPFAALVIMDELPANLETVLAATFRFGVEVLEIRTFGSETSEQMYVFEPFLAELRRDVSGVPDREPEHGVTLDAAEVDTVVVPARDEGFNEVFVKENRWHEVRLHGTMRPQIKYAAAYRLAPTSAITHVAPVRSIEPWKDSGNSC
ncbi:MAG: hypothetical protein DMF84_28540 [Acidobacteria bacterium]|nr:MAG: hypothetical protein DMF84_28540 [Acidobacteriota bacterium]